MEKMTIDGVAFTRTGSKRWEAGDDYEDQSCICVAEGDVWMFSAWHGPRMILRSDYDFPDALSAATAAVSWLKRSRPELYRELCEVES